MTDTRARYPIGLVARRTGLSTHVLRAWERRYEVVTPTRSEGGERLYSPDDILRLRLLRSATEAGMGIGRAAKLSTETLLEMTREASAPAPSERPSADPFVEATLTAIEAMDGPSIHSELMRAAVTLGARDFIDGVAAPLLHQIGALWESGTICPAHEHLFSVQLRRVLAWQLESLPVGSSAPGMVATTPSGQAHELGAMLAAVVSAGEGWRVSYLGPDLPARDIATAVEVTGARAVLLSVVGEAAEAPLISEVRALQAVLSAGTPLLVGGRGAAEHRDALTVSGASWLPDLDALVATLGTLDAGTPPRKPVAEGGSS
jgi:MerR family transcriptional regulator, light-induced transcriptional regulator